MTNDIPFANGKPFDEPKTVRCEGVDNQRNTRGGLGGVNVRRERLKILEGSGGLG